jgi:CheY-like chemotaxis protein
MLGQKDVHLLVIEDDDADFIMIERAFEKAGFINSLVRAKDGVEALEILRGTHGKQNLRRPYLVLSDINMPRMDGLRFLSALRDDPEFKDTVVFMLTTSRHDEDRRKAYGLNVAGYIVNANAGTGLLNLVDLLGSYMRLVEFP